MATPEQLFTGLPASLRALLADERVVKDAVTQNPWFSDFYIREAIVRMIDWFSGENWDSMNAKYRLSQPHSQRNVGIIMAGNLPLVGLHDWLMAMLAGHIATVKLSSKDAILFRALLAQLPPYWQEKTHLVNQISPKEIDFLLATGSNNTARFIRQDFPDTPKLIRKNRFSVGVLTGNESTADLNGLCTDMLLYNGMGCRNISNLIVRHQYDFTNLEAALSAYPKAQLTASFAEVVNWERATRLTRGESLNPEIPVIFEQRERLAPARIGVIHYIYGDTDASTDILLANAAEELQCIVGKNQVVYFGETQSPKIDDFADGADTLHLLRNLP